jgi:hypothetical protein
MQQAGKPTDHGLSFLIGMSADPIARELNGIVS